MASPRKLRKAAEASAPNGLRGGGRDVARSHVKGRTSAVAAGIPQWRAMAVEDAEVEDANDQEPEVCTVPSDQATDCTGFVGDLDLDAWDGSGPINLRPEFDSGATYQVPTEVGDWPDDDPNLKTGPAGTFGVLCGNWGGQLQGKHK